MCRVPWVARIGWYAWCLSRYQRNHRQQFRLACNAAVSKAFTRAKHNYGAPHFADELPEYNVKTIAARDCRRKLAGISAQSVIVHQLYWYRKICWNRIFYASEPDQKWAGDITYLRTDEGCLYLAVVTDLWFRAVMGWLMSRLSLHAMFWKWRSDGENVWKMSLFTPTGIVSMVQRIIRRYWNGGVCAAVWAPKGCCYDNVCFHSLKVECLHSECFISRGIMRTIVI